MRVSRLDRRVRKEATALLREARAALLHKPDLRGKAGALAPIADEVDKALAANDLVRVRRSLPILDSLIDELVKAAPKKGVTTGAESLITAVLLALVLRAFVIEAFKIPSGSMYPTLEVGDHIFVNKFVYGLRVPFTQTKFFEQSPARGDVIVFMQPCTPERDFIKRVVALAGDTIEVRCNVVYVNGEPIEQELIPGQCSYEDKLDDGPWETKACSRYRETLAGHSYETFQPALYPETPNTPAHTDFPSLEVSFSGSAVPPSCASAPRPDSPGPAPNQATGALVRTRAEGEAEACAPQLHYVVPEGHVFAMGDNRANSSDSRVWGSVPLENVKGKAMFIWLSARGSALDPRGWRWDRMGELLD